MDNWPFTKEALASFNPLAELPSSCLNGRDDGHITKLCNCPLDKNLHILSDDVREGESKHSGAQGPDPTMLCSSSRTSDHGASSPSFKTLFTSETGKTSGHRSSLASKN